MRCNFDFRSIPLPQRPPAVQSLLHPSRGADMSEVPGAVTVVATRKVKAGHESAYEAWLGRLIHEVSALPGYLGANIVRPAAGGAREYTSVFRFDSVEHLRAFEESELRQRALADVAPHVEADA